MCYALPDRTRRRERARDCHLPVDRSSTTRTASPRVARASTAWEPITPRRGHQVARHPAGHHGSDHCRRSADEVAPRRVATVWSIAQCNCSHAIFILRHRTRPGRRELARPMHSKNRLDRAYACQHRDIRVIALTSLYLSTQGRQPGTSAARRPPASRWAGLRLHGLRRNDSGLPPTHIVCDGIIAYCQNAVSGDS